MNDNQLQIMMQLYKKKLVSHSSMMNAILDKDKHTSMSYRTSEEEICDRDVSSDDMTGK